MAGNILDAAVLEQLNPLLDSTPGGTASNVASVLEFIANCCTFDTGSQLTANELYGFHLVMRACVSALNTGAVPEAMDDDSRADDVKSTALE